MALQEAKKGLNPNTILVSHGVDYEHFSKAVAHDLPAPADIADLPHPRLGFFGLIRDWVDLDLLAEVARRRPDWHLVLIGDSAIDLSPYQSLPNMHFLGRKPYAELPAYCQEFDVGLVPFRINELTKAVNPIKLREYLAAGLPVVSTPLPEAKLCGSLVESADEPESFAAAVAKTLAGGTACRTSRSATMRTETWPEKVDEICLRLSGAVRG
jgi:glycosyltransferase involved in cell wall biosynthesis